MCLKFRPKNVPKSFISTHIEIIDEYNDKELMKYMCQTLYGQT